MLAVSPTLPGPRGWFNDAKLLIGKAFNLVAHLETTSSNLEVFQGGYELLLKFPKMNGQRGGCFPR